MKKILIFIFVLFISGCTHLYKIYEYERVSIPGKFGTLQASALGTWKKLSKKPEVTINAEPYSVRLVYSTQDEPGKNILIKVINVSPSSQEWGVYKSKKSGVTMEPSLTEDKDFKSCSVALITDIYPGHEPITIEVEVHYDGNIDNFEFELKPKYLEEHHNNTIDGIMGI